MRLRVPVMLLLLALASACLADKPVLVVLPVVSDTDKGQLGEKVRQALNEKFLRSFEYSAVNLDDADRALKREGIRLAPDTAAADVASFADKAYHARFVVWGFCTRQTEGWIIRIMGMDLEHSKEQLRWDFSQHVTTYREVAVTLNRFAADISGYRPHVAVEPEVPVARRRKPPLQNLVKNSGFEEGQETPAFWRCVDNLTTFWDMEAGNPGRCLRVNTDVLDDQAMEWREAIAKGADFRKPPPRKPTREPKYDTIAGLHGVHFPSDPIPVKRGVVYRVTVDLKGHEGAKVFTKGYATFQATDFAGQDREIYNNYLACKEESVDAGNGYRRYTRTFLPNPFYAAFDIEDRARSDHAARASDLLRRAMKERDFPLIPLDEQKKRLAATRAVAGFDTPLPELTMIVRDRLLCAQAIYGKVERAEEGLCLFLRLMSARLKQSLPILDLRYPISDERSMAAACADFLGQCERRFPFVQYVRVIPYPYWPPGIYYFDNVTLTEEGDTLW